MAKKTPQELLGQLSDLADEELAELESKLRDEFNSADTAEGGSDVEGMRRALDGIKKVQAEAQNRIDAAQMREELPPAGELPKAEEGEETSEPAPQEEPATPAETPAPEAPKIVAQEGEGESGEGEEEGGGEGDEGAAPAESTVPESIAAAAPKGVPAVKLGRPGEASPPVGREPRTPVRPPVTIVAASDIPGVQWGSEFNSMLDVAKAIKTRRAAMRGPSTGYEQVPVATIQHDWPEDRKLIDDAEHNGRLIENVISPRALTASGGFCAPVNVHYGLMNISDASRPVRDSLPTFMADRGGIRFITPPSLATFYAATGQWTEAADIAADPGKGCLHVACGAEVEVLTYAVHRCLEFGNLGARAFPEQVADATEKTIAAHARLGERLLLDAIGNNSVAVTHAKVLGAYSDVLGVVEQAADAIRDRQRMADGVALRLIAPRWLRGAIRLDVARQMAGDGLERYAYADAAIAAAFAARNIAVTWSMDIDSATGASFAAQGANVALIEYPDTAVLYLFHEGAHLFLDNGILDLGLVRDSTLNNTNDYRIFAETFEATAFVGLESLQITATICPDGVTQLGQTVDPCSAT